MITLNEAVEFFRIWSRDINTISIKRYDDVIELLINEHYLLTIKKQF